MKKLASLLENVGKKLPEPSLISAIPIGKVASVSEVKAATAQTKTLVNMLFARFMTIYGHKFKSTFESEQEIVIAKREWATSLQGYGEDVLVLAIERAKREYNWMPTIAEFLQLLQQCQQAFGLPDAESAYVEACRHADSPSNHGWSHAAVYHAGRMTGWYELRQGEQKRLRPRYQANYQGLCERVLRGEQLAMPPLPALPDQRTDHLFRLIEQWCTDVGVTLQQGHSLLYYLHKHPATPLYRQLREQAQRQLLELGLEIVLPSTVAELVDVVSS
jgi:hypothetical protein